MKKLTLLLTAWLLGYSFLMAQNVNVTLQVDMKEAVDLYDGGSVWVYMDDNWSEYYDMTDADADGIYTYILEKNVDSTLTYRFSYQTGADPWNDYVVETVPEACANGDGFRELLVPDADTVLPVFAYGSCDENPPTIVSITFQVDLNQIDNLYGGGSVWVYMDDNWSEYYDMTDEDEDGIYTFTVEKDVQSTLTYRFAYQTGADPNNDYAVETVPAECANNDGFREFLVTGVPRVLPAFAFGSCDENAPTMINITFQVDMSEVTVLNNDVQVVIKNPWIWTALLDNGNGIWSGTVEVQANATYPYTFVNGGQDNWSGEERVPAACNFGTETAPERHITVADVDTTLEVVGFGQCGSSTVDKVNVTFRVDMNDETVSGEGVQVVIKEPWTWIALSDNGQGIWEGTAELTANSVYPYSFINGAKDYWAGEETIVGDCKDGDENQRLAEIGQSDTTLTAYIFGTCSERLTPVDNVEHSDIFKVYPNPADNMLMVESAEYGFNTISIFDLAGTLVALPQIKNKNQVMIDISEIDNGIYILVIESEKVKAYKRLVISR